LKQTSK